jgi:hypothetical protein
MNDSEVGRRVRLIELGDCSVKLHHFIDQLKHDFGLNDYEIYWLVSQVLTSRISADGKAAKVLP